MSMYRGTETGARGGGIQEQCAVNRSHGNPKYCHKHLLKNPSVRQADSRTNMTIRALHYQKYGEL